MGKNPFIFLPTHVLYLSSCRITYSVNNFYIYLKGKEQEVMISTNILPLSGLWSILWFPKMLMFDCLVDRFLTLLLRQSEKGMLWPRGSQKSVIMESRFETSPADILLLHVLLMVLQIELPLSNMWERKYILSK